MAQIRLRIPKEYQPGFAGLLNLEDATIEELLSALSVAPSVYDIDELAVQLEEKVKTIPLKEARLVISTLISLHGLRAEMGHPPIAEFADAVCRAMDETGNDELKLSDESREQFKSRLISLLSGPYLDIATKAVSLLYDHQRAFQTARIITDIRSIFGSDVEDEPRAAILIHMLKIDYIEDRQRKELFVALDDTDIPLLIDALERAKKKAESLKRVLSSTNVAYIGSK